MTFGRKRVEQSYSEAEFGRLVRNFDRARIIKIGDAQAEIERMRFIANASGAQVNAIPAIYGRRIAAAKEALDDHIASLNDYLAATAISWRIEPLMVIGPSVWQDTPLSNFLIYALGMTPFDPWNQVLTVNHPIGSADLGMAYFQAAAEEQLSADFCNRYQIMVDDWDVAEKLYEKKREIAVLTELADISRSFIDGDTRHMRKLIAWNLFGGAGVEPQFH